MLVGVGGQVDVSAHVSWEGGGGLGNVGDISIVALLLIGLTKIS
jgi:hypothetical protein